MKIWHRVTLIVLIGSFPLGVYGLVQSSLLPPAADLKAKPSVDPLKAEAKTLEHAVDIKVREIAEIDTKILVNRGEGLKLAEQRVGVIQDLERIQNRIRPIVEKAKANSPLRR